MSALSIGKADFYGYLMSNFVAIFTPTAIINFSNSQRL